jgi:hypothetical protein
MKRVIIHFERDAVAPDYYIEEGVDVQVIVVDERAPHDRVYELTQRWPAATIDPMLGSDPIGSRFDGRHEAIAARILAAREGKPHLAIVTDPPQDPAK